jgi:TetR/AcrR family transcriptional regulator, transcriptional repressor of bet genes
MAVGSINQYFESKEALYTAVLEALSAEFTSAIEAGLAQAGPAPSARLRAFVQTYFAPSICQRRKIAVWFAFWGEVRARPQYRVVCAGYDRGHDATLAELCAQLRISGAAATARLVAATCQGLWLEFLTGDARLDRDALAELADRSLAAYYPDYAREFPGGPLEA